MGVPGFGVRSHGIAATAPIQQVLMRTQACLAGHTRKYAGRSPASTRHLKWRRGLRIPDAGERRVGAAMLISEYSPVCDLYSKGNRRQRQLLVDPFYRFPIPEQGWFNVGAWGC